MPRTVSASEAQKRFGAMTDWAVESEDEVIVESHGTPKVVIIPMAEYERLVEWREEARQRDLLARLRALRERVRARNQDLTAEEAEALADRASHEMIDNMIAENKIHYEGR